jgi:phosphopantetheine adenylyltransferase
MNSLVKALIQPILEETKRGIALIPGGFKPPTLGHFYLVDEIAKRPEVSKVIVLIGHKDRDGITKEESKQIWNIYKKYLPSNIEIQISQNPSPITDVNSIIKNDSINFYFPVAGLRGEEDMGDLKRFDSLKGKYDNFKPIIIKSESKGDRVSGTNARLAVLNGEYESFQRYLPTEISNEDRDKIWSILTKTPIQEIMYAEPSKFSYPTMLSSLIQYMLSKGMNIRPLPKVKFIEDDVENARDFFGKTAYYNPSEKSIVLYTMDRHPKDVMRSFAHEMIHHEQNCNGKLQNINTTNTNEDGDLPEIEREAYEKGNMMFRNWTDTITEGVLKENKEEDDGTLLYKSAFKPDINILVTFKNYENYPNLDPLFDEYGYGFYHPESKTIILDGEVFVDSDLDFKDMKIVEAHEIAHLLLGHTGPYSADDEMDADLGAYLLLKDKGFSTEKLEKQFKFRHGVDFSEELLERVKGKL